MEAIARYRKLAVSPRKTRLVVDLIRNMKVSEATAVLQQLTNRSAPYILKALRSAVANLQHKHARQVKHNEVYISEVYVDGGRVLKRIQPAPQGRAHPIRKPSCHITLRVALYKREEAPIASQAAVKKQAQTAPATSVDADNTAPASTEQQEPSAGKAKEAHAQGSKGASRTAKKK